jgi:ssDNA-binding Zn-finger/Zn-ribbon topoisomerase 1
MITKGTGEFHKRLIQNLCPKCEQKLKIVKKDAKNLVRFCGICNLTVSDQIENAEYLEEVCD